MKIEGGMAPELYGRCWRLQLFSQDVRRTHGEGFNGRKRQDGKSD